MNDGLFWISALIFVLSWGTIGSQANPNANFILPLWGNIILFIVGLVAILLAELAIYGGDG